MRPWCTGVSTCAGRDRLREQKKQQQPEEEARPGRGGRVRFHNIFILSIVFILFRRRWGWCRGVASQHAQCEGRGKQQQKWLHQRQLLSLVVKATGMGGRAGCRGAGIAGGGRDTRSNDQIDAQQQQREQQQLVQLPANATWWRRGRTTAANKCRRITFYIYLVFLYTLFFQGTPPSDPLTLPFSPSTVFFHII